MITGAAKVAGVVGWPVAHSLSPLIHNAWIAALGLDAAYVPFAVPPERFAAFVHSLRGGGFAGLNVTLPHKQAAFEAATSAQDAAEHAGAANLLMFHSEEIVADNTDGVGLVLGLREHGVDPHGADVLLLGAGGAALGVARALLEAGASRLRIAARRFPAAAAVASATGWRAEPIEFDFLTEALDGATLVVNATSAGLKGEGRLPPMDAAPPGAVFMDMVYNPLRTTFLRDAAARGHPTIDGLAMLIGQARPSFEALFGVPPPPTEVVDVRAMCLHALGEASC